MRSLLSTVSIVAVCSVFGGCASDPDASSASEETTAEAELSSALGCDGPELKAADVRDRFGDRDAVPLGTYNVEGKTRHCFPTRGCDAWSRTFEHLKTGRLAGRTTLHRGPNGAVTISLSGIQSGPRPDDKEWLAQLRLGAEPDANGMSGILQDPTNTTFTSTRIGRRCLAMTAKKVDVFENVTIESEYTLRAVHAPTPAPIDPYFATARVMTVQCSDYELSHQYTCTGRLEGEVSRQFPATVQLSPDGKSVRYRIEHSPQWKPLSVMGAPYRSGDFDGDYALRDDGFADAVIPTMADESRSLTITAAGGYLNVSFDHSDSAQVPFYCGVQTTNARRFRCTGTLMAP